MVVRPLTIDDVDDYLRHVADVDAGSGVDGAPHSHPYTASESFDPEDARRREATRWTTAVDAVGWRRAWGAFDDDEMVGHVYLAGGPLPTGLHRAELGIGVAASHRRRGVGTLLLEAAVEWARARPGIEWIDLGVFSDNPGAEALYRRHGFRVQGRIPDRFRIDGVVLHDTQMALRVGPQAEGAGPTSSR